MALKATLVLYNATDVAIKHDTTLEPSKTYYYEIMDFAHKLLTIDDKVHSVNYLVYVEYDAKRRNQK